MKDGPILFERACDLASVIHADVSTARAVARAAIDRLPTAVRAQDKRLYYDRDGARPSKVWFDREHLLQQLVFAASDRAERLDESRRALGERDLLVRFLKHLIWISTRRNVFYVTIAVARMQFEFSAPQTAEIYSRLIDDPDAAKDDAYCRARSRVLVDEMSRRFPFALQVDAGRIATARAGVDARAVAERCLRAFAPWGTSCDGDRDDDVHRMHVLLHPSCFRAYIMEMSWPDPLPRLRVPRFETTAASPNHFTPLRISTR